MRFLRSRIQVTRPLSGFGYYRTARYFRGAKGDLATKWRQVVVMGVSRFSPVATTFRPVGTIVACRLKFTFDQTAKTITILSQFRLSNSCELENNDRCRES